MLKVEEEGRKAWLQSRDSATTTTTTTNMISTSPTAGGVGGKDGGVALGNDGRNYGVRVGRSGGGV